MEKRLRLSDSDQMLLLLALADYAESHAEYRGLDIKVWMLAERLMGASPGPAPQNVALWIREQTGTVNGPMDTYLPNGQVPNEEPPAGNQPAEKGRGEKSPVEAEQRPEHESTPVTSAVSVGLEAPAPATGEHILRAWQDGRNYQRGRLERERESIKKGYGYGWRERRKMLEPLKRCQVPACHSAAYGMTPTRLVVCKDHYAETPPDDWKP